MQKVSIVGPRYCLCQRAAPYANALLSVLMGEGHRPGALARALHVYTLAIIEYLCGEPLHNCKS